MYFLGLNITSINIATHWTKQPVFQLSNAEVLPYKVTAPRAEPSCLWVGFTAHSLP